MAVGTSAKHTRSYKDMMVDLLRERPDLVAPGGGRRALIEFEKKYKIPTKENTFYAAARQVRQEVMEQPPVAIHEEPIAPSPEPSRVPLPAAPFPSPFVPEPLMENILPIKDACDLAGGIDAAEQVAAVIERAGGVENFLSACQLLRRVVRQPDVNVPLLPSDINARR